jgi:hypothetical protein
MHPAHGGTHHQAKMIHAEPLCEESELSFHHIEVPVVGELRVKTVARFAGFSVTDSIGGHNEVFFGIKGLSLIEEFAGKLIAVKLTAASGCAVLHKDGVAD